MAGLIPITRDDIDGARRRAAAERTPAPQVGEWVRYRHNEWDTDLYPAEVLAVQHLHRVHELWGDPRTDGNMWELADGIGSIEVPPGTTADDLPPGWLVPHSDPWPLVRLRVPDLGLPAVDCREARVRASPGWLREA